MEQDFDSHGLVPYEGQKSLLPVVTLGRTLEMPAQNKRGLAKLADWIADHPAARLGLATVAIAVGTYLSRRMPREQPVLPSQVQRRNSQTGEWTVTAVGLSIQSDCEEVSIWSIFFGE